jgi:opacity protein-like surface antigen
MKKVLIIAAVALFAGSVAQAQDIYKQTGGEQNIEVLFAPLGGSPIGINGIKYRKFTSATTAWRVEAFVGFTSSTDIVLDMESNGDEVELKDRSSSFDIVLSPGMEWHLPGTDRLSPYYGGVLNIGFSRQTEKSEFLFGADEDIEEGTTRDGSIGLGLAAIGGFDYYFADNIYLGAEIGVGFGFTSFSDTVSESTIPDTDTVETPNGSSIEFGPVFQGRIRLGILF